MKDVNEVRNDYELLSLSKAASEMSIGITALHQMINSGLIGVIPVGKREKISRGELKRFEKEFSQKLDRLSNNYFHNQITANDILIRPVKNPGEPLFTRTELENLFNKDR